jgi:hypothetical protein
LNVELFFDEQKEEKFRDGGMRFCVLFIAVEKNEYFREKDKGKPICSSGTKDGEGRRKVR